MSARLLLLILYTWPLCAVPQDATDTLARPVPYCKIPPPVLPDSLPTTGVDSVAGPSMSHADSVFALYDADAYRQPILYPHRDTTWYNFSTGGRVHLQVLNRTTDTLRYVRRSVTAPVLEALGINFGVWGYDYLTGREWAKVTANTISRNVRHNFVLDCDSYSGNQFSHPYHGSMFYNAARYHGHSYYTAALYPLIGSAVWEYFCETNLPSYNDFLSTGIGGTAIGEVTHRTSDLVFDNSKTGFGRVVREIVGTALNPARGVHRLFSGEMWRFSSDRGKIETPQPFSLNVSLGTRHIKETRHLHRSRDIAYVDLLLVYGDHFWLNKDPKPFDFFTLHMLLNTSPNNPTFSDVDIRGRILGVQYEGVRQWKVDLGVYQNFRYVDNYGSKDEERAGDFAMFCEAASFGIGCYTAKVGRLFTFSNETSLNGIIFGAVANDTYFARRYNYASGFSVRNDMRLSLNRRITLGEEFYLARLFTPKGPEDPTTQHSSYDWGEKGQVTVMQLRFFAHVNLRRDLYAGTSFSLFQRRANYAYSPDVHAHSNELTFSVTYSI